MKTSLNRLHRTTTPGTFTIKWLTSCLLPRQRETKCRQEKPSGRLRQSEVFFPLAIVAHHVVPPGVCPGLIQNHPDHVFDRAFVIFDKVWRTSTMLVSPFWFLRLPGPVTERGGNQRPPSMAINTTTALDSFGLLDPPFSFTSTAHSKYRWRKNIRIREKSVYTAKLSGFKSFRIQSSHFRFRIQNLRRHDQTGMFSFRIRPLVCKRQNQSGTKTFRIHHESGTISSSVNLVSMIARYRRKTIFWRRIF